jgi:hypothetical protein
MPHSIVRQLLLLSACLMLSIPFGCGDDSTGPEPPEVWPPVDPSSPDNVITMMEIAYNDTAQSANDRLAAYASLFDTAFVFRFQPADIAHGLPATWGLEEELAAHHSIFDPAAGQIYSLELRITREPARDLTPPEPGRKGWKEVFATNVYLRLMFNVDDGLEVNGGQAEFKFPPPDVGRSQATRFRIADWTDLPRPGLTAVDPMTWGKIKTLFNRP